MPGGCGSVSSPCRSCPTLKEGSATELKGTTQQSIEKKPGLQEQQLLGPVRTLLLPKVSALHLAKHRPLKSSSSSSHRESRRFMDL